MRGIYLNFAAHHLQWSSFYVSEIFSNETINIEQSINQSMLSIKFSLDDISIKLCGIIMLNSARFPSCPLYFMYTRGIFDACNGIISLAMLYRDFDGFILSLLKKKESTGSFH